MNRSSDIGLVDLNIIRQLLYHLIPWLTFQVAQNPSQRSGFIHSSLIRQRIRALYYLSSAKVVECYNTQIP